MVPTHKINIIIIYTSQQLYRTSIDRIILLGRMLLREVKQLPLFLSILCELKSERVEIEVHLNKKSFEEKN